VSTVAALRLAPKEDLNNPVEPQAAAACGCQGVGIIGRATVEHERLGLARLIVIFMLLSDYPLKGTLT